MIAILALPEPDFPLDGAPLCGRPAQRDYFARLMTEDQR